ncbi:hypothetical protein ANTRET_LOCUS1325 [Anthophora retusa]
MRAAVHAATRESPDAWVFPLRVEPRVRITPDRLASRIDFDFPEANVQALDETIKGTRAPEILRRRRIANTNEQRLFSASLPFVETETVSNLEQPTTTVMNQAYGPRATRNQPGMDQVSRPTGFGGSKWFRVAV